MEKCLVVGCGVSKKDKKPYITFRVWNDRFNSWTTQKTSTGYGDYFAFIDDADLYEYVHTHLGDAVILMAECYVTEFKTVGYTNFTVV